MTTDKPLAEVLASEAYKLYWLKHELLQAEVKGDTKEMAKLQKQIEEVEKCKP